MASTLKNAQLTLTGSGTQDTLITAGASVEIIIKGIQIVNYSVSTITVRMWVNGVANNNMVLPPTTMEAGDYGAFNGEIVLEPNDTLRAEANTASACTVTVSYVEIT